MPLMSGDESSQGKAKRTRGSELRLCMRLHQRRQRKADIVIRTGWCANPLEILEYE